jgi:quercetin dioxygenase-like cupin family protein
MCAPKTADWAKFLAHDPKTGETTLSVSSHALPIPMDKSVATAKALLSNGHLGADLIRLKAGTSFAPHTHPGDHLLIIVAGEGTMTYGGKIFPTHAGQILMIEGAVPHAVGAITDHVILAVGSPHKAADDPERMALVEYAEIAASTGDLHCLICDVRADSDTPLHTQGCCHCPCSECAQTQGAGEGHGHSHS